MRSPGKSSDLLHIERCSFESLPSLGRTFPDKRKPTRVNLAERADSDRDRASFGTVRWPRHSDARSSVHLPALRWSVVKVDLTRGRVWLLRCFLPSSRDDAACR